jgi:hypothetical protein
MTVVRTPEQVAEAIQQVKAGAADFCTNIFPSQPRLKGWIDRGELACEMHPGTVFLLRRDRDFQHLYFSASEPASLQRDLERLQCLASERITADLIGSGAALQKLVEVFSTAGFSAYSRLLRLSRTGEPSGASTSADAPVGLAELSDAPVVLGLIESSFDRYADQLPALHEIEHAISAGQIFVVRSGGEIAALLFFETQGLTSVVRYWLVADGFRSHGFGSTVMRHYWNSQSAARRFILWVRATNDDAVSKYRHYSYAPDGLVDHVMANKLIKPE